LGELIGAGSQVDEEAFIKQGVTNDIAPAVIKRAESIIERTGDEYRTVFLNQYKRLMSRRLGLRTQKESDFQELFSELLDTLEALELDFNHFFRRLSSVSLPDLATETGRKEVASIFFHTEGFGGIGYTEDSARERIAKWLENWRQRILEDWGSEHERDQSKSMHPFLSQYLGPRPFSVLTHFVSSFLAAGFWMKSSSV
jgi:uncharacterized protein YdiU (UPF0061 family)